MGWDHFRSTAIVIANMSYEHCQKAPWFVCGWPDRSSGPKGTDFVPARIDHRESDIKNTISMTPVA